MFISFRQLPPPNKPVLYRKHDYTFSTLKVVNLNGKLYRLLTTAPLEGLEFIPNWEYSWSFD